MRGLYVLKRSLLMQISDQKYEVRAFHAHVFKFSQSVSEWNACDIHTFHTQCIISFISVLMYRRQTEKRKLGDFLCAL